jgi:2-polyprenyl-6-methoxyphenol hydroxylase-like FAD-dependent oxidoreductase
MPDTGANTRGHAVVIGASIAGLCAAKVLADFFDRVTVFERDELPSTPACRATVPQDRHLHLLMARGAIELDNLFPGLLADMVDAGVPKLENRPAGIHLGAVGHVLGTGRSLRKEFTAYVPSRPHLEWQVRKRVSDINNVEIVRRAVAEPRFDRARQRVTGVQLDASLDSRLDSRLDSNDAGEFISADLVVDAAGRGTRLPVWLTQWGYPRPGEETVDIGISYASHRFRIPDGLICEQVVVNGASSEQSLGLGMLCYEGGTWILTSFGVANAKPPPTFDEMRALAYRLLPAHFAAALARAEPVGSPAFHAFPVSRWRRYDKLDRFPAGIVPLGDAVASFNPTFGQGMTMTSLQAGNLRRALQSTESCDGDLAAELNRATAKTTRPVWTMNAIADRCFHHADGETPGWYRPVGALFDQFLGAAETEPVLAEWFLRRFSLLDSLYLIPPASIIGRAMAHNMRLWLGERRGQSRWECRSQRRRRH